MKLHTLKTGLTKPPENHKQTSANLAKDRSIELRYNQKARQWTANKSHFQFHLT